jgi:hypothetical protein
LYAGSEKYKGEALPAEEGADHHHHPNVAAPHADRAKIEETIKTMPAYFADYDTTVHFISQEELDRDHKGIPHGGFVLRSGVTGESGETKQMIEYSLKLGSNPEFTASVLVACARAVCRMASEGQVAPKPSSIFLPPISPPNRARSCGRICCDPFQEKSQPKEGGIRLPPSFSVKSPKECHPKPSKFPSYSSCSFFLLGVYLFRMRNDSQIFIRKV